MDKKMHKGGKSKSETVKYDKPKTGKTSLESTKGNDNDMGSKTKSPATYTDRPRM